MIFQNSNAQKRNLGDGRRGFGGGGDPKVANEHLLDSYHHKNSCTILTINKSTSMQYSETIVWAP